MMPDTHCPEHLRRVRRDTDAALAHVDEDLAPIMPPPVSWWWAVLGVAILVACNVAVALWMTP
jgi:hypothetical protein